MGRNSDRLMSKIKWEIGCSGFHYKEWKGIFYPESLPQKEWFKYYAEKFNTLELNVTFYRFPRPEALLRWHDRSPEKFKFSVNAKFRTKPTLNYGELDASVFSFNFQVALTDACAGGSILLLFSFISICLIDCSIESNLLFVSLEK